MIRKSLKAVLILLLIFILLFISVVLWIFYKNDIHIVFSVDKVEKAESVLQWDDKLNLKQSLNACGSYSTMAYLFASKGESYDPEKIKIEYEEHIIWVFLIAVRRVIG